MNDKTAQQTPIEKPKKFLFWKKKERKKPETFVEKVVEFFRQLFWAAIAAFFIITFIIQNTRIPTGSMEDTILVGDFVLVNKFIYGSSSPKYIPFTQIELPFFRLPALLYLNIPEIVINSSQPNVVLIMLKDVLVYLVIRSR